MGDKFESFRSLNLLVFEQHFVSEHLARGISSVGRASGWQPEGQGFASPILHFNLLTNEDFCSALKPSHIKYIAGC